ncbi:MAG TPA: hypothetical protein PLQ67_09020, partial [Burkholderiaceae bacterium]|nr:hypothetical protein [Burkholderiaceae bacterium]
MAAINSVGQAGQAQEQAAALQRKLEALQVRVEANRGGARAREPGNTEAFKEDIKKRMAASSGVHEANQYALEQEKKAEAQRRALTGADAGAGNSELSKQDKKTVHVARVARASELAQTALGAKTLQSVSANEPLSKVDPQRAAEVMYGLGNSNVTPEQAKAVMGKILAENAGNSDRAADLIFETAIAANVSAKQLADLQWPGITRDSIDAYLQDRHGVSVS